MSQPSLNVLLGVSGGIAAYKAITIVRQLRERGHQVRCALTRSAHAFVTPLSLEVLSEQPVYGEEYLTANGSGQELHIEAARWADVLCVAPATANTLARLALGLADDFLSTTALAFRGPRVLAPAMHFDMWDRSSVQGHVEALRREGATIVGPCVGPLASGEVGAGRMAEPEQIVDAIERRPNESLGGFKVVVSAGPTREFLDPVRFLTNRSSGKMGFAIASEAALRGAETVLVTGPVERPTPTGVMRVEVTSALEMLAALEEHSPDAHLVVMAAAVADYRPVERFERKIKKSAASGPLELEENPDILARLATVAPQAVRVGFAAETGELAAEARRKKSAKRAHFVVANDVSDPAVGFDSDDNEVVLYGPGEESERLPRASKRQIARQLWDRWARFLEARATVGPGVSH